MGKTAALRETASKRSIAVPGPRGSVPDPSSSPPETGHTGPRLLCAWDPREGGRRPAAGWACPPTHIHASRPCRFGSLGLPARRACPVAPRPRRGPTGPAALARPARQPPTAAARAPSAAWTHRGQLPSTWWRCRGPRPRAGRALHGPRRREPRGAAGRSIRPGAAAWQNRFTRRGRGGGRRRREQRGRGAGGGRGGGGARGTTREGGEGGREGEGGEEGGDGGRRRKRRRGRWRGGRGQGRRLEAARAQGATGRGRTVAAPCVVALSRGPQRRPGAREPSEATPGFRARLAQRCNRNRSPPAPSGRAGPRPAAHPPLHLGLAL